MFSPFRLSRLSDPDDPSSLFHNKRPQNIVIAHHHHKTLHIIIISFPLTLQHTAAPLCFISYFLINSPMAATVPPTPPANTQAGCNSILHETIRLLTKTTPLACGSQDRLNSLLSCFFQDDANGAAFRSLLCTGRIDTPVTIAQFNQFVIWPTTKYQFQLEAFVHIPIQFHAINSLTRIRLNKDILRHAEAKVAFVHDDVVVHHPQKALFQSFSNKLPGTWKKAILGIKGRSQFKCIDIPSFTELQSRIKISLDFSLSQKANLLNSQIYTTASGGAWSVSSAKMEINYEEIYLQSCSEFPAYLESLLKENDQFLDEHAGVKVPHTYPAVEARFKKLLQLCPDGPHVEALNLMKGKNSHELGGTVCAIHEYLSARFLAYYVVDHDASCKYMADVRSGHKKDRKIRVASSKHVNTKPVWVQLGETSNVYLYFSQKASVAEESWLVIVNHVMKLLVEFVNSKIKALHGSNTAHDKLLRLRIFTELISNASLPVLGNFGPHGDDRNGTCSKDDPKFSRFMLMVPTFCLQNYALETTKISWSPRSEPGWVAGCVFQYFCLIHIQLLGVQEFFLHYVSYVRL